MFKKDLIMVSPKHNINVTIEGTVIDIIYVGELEMYIVLTYRCANIVCDPARCLMFRI